jgi:PAS domain S-box-containing protein
MPAIQYPFIDIAVHERVRDHFAAGEAVVLFSPDMQAPLWANGEGARLFGFSSIYDFLDQGPDRSNVSFRQIAAAARPLATRGDVRHVTIRVTAGFQRQAIQARCEMIEVHGEAIVLFSAALEAARLTDAARAARMIEGFDDPETHMAVLGLDGAVLAASSEFAALEISPQTAQLLTSAASADPGRLIKRPIPTIKGYLPAAIGMPCDAPAMFLLFTVDTTAQNLPVTEQALPAAEQSLPVTGESLPLTEQTLAETAEPEAAEAPVAEADAAPGFADVLDAVAEIEEAPEPAEEISLLVSEPADAQSAVDIDAGEHLIEIVSEDDTPVVVDDMVPVANDEPVQIEAFVEPVADEPLEPEPVAADSVASETAQVPDGPEAAAIPSEGFVFQRDARAIRFVWKIDGDGHFMEVSKEFAAAVGPHAADVVGMAFVDIAAIFHLDPDGKIAELLNRRDTWSGKTIRWPVEGTSLTVPVDLAALPTYTRTREFDGFRGFGIVRIADASEDPHAVGLSLVTRTEAPDTLEVDFPEAELPEVEAAEDHAPEAEETVLDQPPVSGDVPAILTEEVADIVAGLQPPEAEPLLPLDESVADAIAPEDNTPEEVTADAIAPVEPAAPETADTSAEQLDWPAGERPALRLVPTAGRRYSDKVIELEERRSRLSPGEQAAFREIARQLDRFIGSNDQPGADPGRGAPSEPESTLSSQEAVTDLPAGLPPEAEILPTEPETTAEEADPTVPESLETVHPIEEPTAEPVVASEETASEPEADTTGSDASAEDIVAETSDNAVESDDQVLDEEAPVEDADTVVEEPTAEEESREVSADIPDRELLSQLMPIRERIGLSAEIIDQMPVALLVHSGDRLFHGNPEFLKLTGYETIEELAELGGLDALLQRQDLEDKTSEASGMVVVRADDEIIPVTARLQSVRWGDATALMLALMPAPAPRAAVAAVPEPLLVPVADTDALVSEDSGAEILPLLPVRQADQLARLQVEVEELRAILETATDGVVIIDENGNIRSVNRAASGLFNYDNDEINEKPFVVLFAHESQKAILDYLSGLAGHGVASVLNDGREVIGREASGGFLPLFMTIGRLTSSNGYCAVIRDITQWKRTEEELRTAKRAAETANAHKSEFLAHVSHEIRTPLNAIIGFADMMASERFGPIGHPRYIEYANDINRSGRHVLDIVNDLLDISKIEAGEMEMDFIAVGLNETVSEAVSLVQPQANNQRVIIRTALSNSVPQVVADIRSIKQIVLNVLSNAIRFTPSGGQIVVSSAYEPNGTVVLRIRDTGIGMTRSELELAMKPFRQVAGTARKRGDGTGLGLPLTKAMVDANRASFAISSAPNEGTLVEITFPPQRVLAN